jgi:peroxiredoxin
MDLGFDVVEFDDSDHPTEGDVAPDFTRPLVNDEFWEDVALSELTAEGPVLLVFHSMDGAFPATYTWKGIRERDWDAEGLTIVGVSISSPYEHKSFIDDRDLPHRLFSDPTNEVAEAYGVVHDLDGMAGIAEPRPAVFLLSRDRVVEYAWVAGEWPEFPDYAEVEAAVDAL